MRILKKIFIYGLILSTIFTIWFVWFWIFGGTAFPLKEEVITQSGTFTLGASLPQARTEAGGTAYENKFFVAGGIGAYAQTFNTFYSYDAEKDEWERLADLPEPINHAGVAAYKGKVYIVGGFEPIGIRLRGFMFADWRPLNTLYIYDINSNSWEKGPDMPAPRGAGGLTLAEGALWYVGGINEEKKISNSLFRFDIATNQWEEKTGMPTARDHLRLEAVDGSLYAISGREDDLRFNLATLEAYDINTGKWARKADIPTPRGGFGSAVLDGYIYTFGGEHVWNCYNLFERYNPSTDQWEVLDPLPETRHGILGGVINNRLHLISGGVKPRISISGIHRIYEPGK
ncbi:MAG: Kelch repeat-containing protein [Cytophagaceae bacterium]